MVGHMAVLLIFQLAGELVVTVSGLQLPGPVVGMALLFLCLLARDGPGAEFDGFARGFLGYLGLLFVPPGVGVVLYLELIADAWLPILGALFLGTAFTMAVTGWLMQRVSGVAAQGDDR